MSNAADPKLQERVVIAAKTLLKDSGSEGFLLPMGDDVFVCAGTKAKIEEMFGVEFRPYRRGQSEPGIVSH